MSRKTCSSFFMMLRSRAFAVSVVSTLLFSGCASVDPQYMDPRDPYENFNRSMYQFNEGLDNAILKPVAKGYKAITPVPVDNGVTNFFANVGDVVSAVNNLLQFKLTRAASDVSRVLINTTIGLLGVMDVASNMNIPKYDEDFGQTLGAWGISPGPYLILPFFGPSSGRDAVGVVVDWYTDPVTYLKPDSHMWIAKTLRYTDQRADLLGASKILQQAALDPYEFMRDAYLQKRKNDVYDGNPPFEEDFPN